MPTRAEAAQGTELNWVIYHDLASGKTGVRRCTYSAVATTGKNRPKAIKEDRYFCFLESAQTRKNVHVHLRPLAC